MEYLTRIVEENGDTIPPGLSYVLLHHGTSRKDVSLHVRTTGGMRYTLHDHFGGKLAPQGTTVVYPIEVRKVVRERFPDEHAGEHDAQYDGKGAGTCLTLKQIAQFNWRPPPAKCALCKPVKDDKKKAGNQG